MECYRCDHRKVVESGRYAVTPYAETPCAKCKLDDASLHTLEADTEDRTDPLEIAAPAIDEEREDVMPVSVLAECVRQLMALPQDVRDVVCMRVLGLTYREIARRQGLTTAGAEARHERGMNLFPPLRQMFARKTAKVAMRKKTGSVALS